MITINYDIKSQELKRIFDLEIKNRNQKLFFSSMSKLSSLYNLSAHKHEYARIELYRIISNIDRFNKKYSKELSKYKTSLSKYQVNLKSLRNIQFGIGNPVSLALFESMQNIDLIEEYDYLVFIKTGRKNKDSIFYEYIQEIRKIITRIYSVGINEIKSKQPNEKEQAIYKASLSHYLLPELKPIKEDKVI